MEKKHLPIGFFDSGVGGLSVLLCAKSRLPKENYIFYGDNANAPYGDKTGEEIQSLTMDAAAFLVEKGIKAMVIACNTATSAAVKMIREKYNIPVISMEPAIKPACEECGDGEKVIVMATKATLSQKRYLDLVSRLGCADKLISMPCCGLVELIERDASYAEKTDYIRQKFSGIEDKISGIVIGCTHYSFVRELIHETASEMLSGKCSIYDGMYGTVKQLGRVLDQNSLANDSGSGNVECYSSKGGDTVSVMRKIIENPKF